MEQQRRGHGLATYRGAAREPVVGGSIDADEVLASVRSIGTALFFVRQLPFGVDGSEDVLHVAFAGASTLAIDGDGRLSLPLYTMQAAGLLPERLVEIPDKGPVPTDLTLESLEELASRPVRHEVIDTSGADASSGG